MNKFHVTLGEIRRTLDHFRSHASIAGNQALWATRPAPLSRSTRETISFSRSLLPVGAVDVRTWSGIVVVNALSVEALAEVNGREDLLVVLCPYPEAIFYTVLQQLCEHHGDIDELRQSQDTLGGLHRHQTNSTAFIDDDVSMGENVVIGAFCSVRRSVIGAMTVLQAGVRVGDDALGAVVGPDGQWIDRPHFGGVVIGCNVRIENNSVIQAGFLDPTTISDNCRIGPLTSVGNGVSIGQGTLIGQSVTIAGSVKIGRGCRIWSNTSIRESVTIGDGVTVGMGSTVVSDIPSNEVWYGNPAKKRAQVTSEPSKQ